MNRFYPIYLEREGLLFTFTEHAIQQLETEFERLDITWEMMDDTLNHPRAFMRLQVVLWSIGRSLAHDGLRWLSMSSGK